MWLIHLELSERNGSPPPVLGLNDLDLLLAARLEAFEAVLDQYGINLERGGGDPTHPTLIVQASGATAFFANDRVLDSIAVHASSRSD